MPKIYEQCGDDVTDLLGSVLEKYHRDLIEAEVTISCLYVSEPSEEEPQPCLEHHGYPALAIVKINSYRDRVEGKADATITIDRVSWDLKDDDEKAAILDHECHHLVLKRHKEGMVKTDDLGRPKLEMRLHDLIVGGFQKIAARHQEKSQEAAQLAVLQKLVQGTFKFG